MINITDNIFYDQLKSLIFKKRSFDVDIDVDNLIVIDYSPIDIDMFVNSLKKSILNALIFTDEDSWNKLIERFNGHMFVYDVDTKLYLIPGMYSINDEFYYFYIVFDKEKFDKLEKGNKYE